MLSIHVGNNRGTKDNVRAELTIEFAVGNEDGQFWGVVRSGCTHCVWWLMKNDFFLGQFGKKNMSFDFGARSVKDTGSKVAKDTFHETKGVLS